MYNFLPSPSWMTKFLAEKNINFESQKTKNCGQLYSRTAAVGCSNK